jgi:hypothetical protein
MIWQCSTIFVMHQYIGDANRFAPVYWCWLAANKKKSLKSSNGV